MKNIGETFQDSKGVTLLVVKSKKNSCKGCYYSRKIKGDHFCMEVNHTFYKSIFKNANDFLCSHEDRSDKNSVIFQQI